jgi:hypothetical protein
MNVDGEVPSVAVEGHALPGIAAGLQRLGQGYGWHRAIVIAHYVDDAGIGAGVQRFEAPDDQERLALARHTQALKAVVAGCLLAAEIKDVLRCRGQE